MAIGPRRSSDPSLRQNGRGKVISLAFFRTDDELTAAFRAGRRDAQAELYRRHWDRVSSVLHRLTGANTELESLAKQTFARAFAESPTFRGSRETLEPWLVSLAVQVARSHLLRRPWRWAGWRWGRVPSRATARLHATERDELFHFFATVGQLRVSVRIPLLLELLDEMSVPEIAEACQTTMHGVKQSLGRAQQEFSRLAAKDPVLVRLLSRKAQGAAEVADAVAPSSVIRPAVTDLQEAAHSGLTAHYSLGTHIRNIQDDLRDDLLAQPDEARLQQLLQGARREGTARKRAAYLGVGVAISALVASGYMLWPRGSSLSFAVDGAPGIQNNWISASVGRPVALSFSDGTRIDIEPGGRGRMVDLGAQGARLILETGRADLTIPAKAHSNWSTSIGPFEATMAASHFTVGWDPEEERLELMVTEGPVHVAGPVIGEGRTLETGQALVVSLPEQRATLASLPGPEE